MKKIVEKKAMTTQVINDNYLGRFLNYMPNPDDIVSGTFDSYHTYRKMLTDPRIKSLLNKKKTSSLIFPSAITQPKGCPDNVFDFINGIELFKQLYKKEKRMLSALNYGFSISEVVWQNPNDNGGKWIPENIITRRPERFEFNSEWKLYWHEFGIKQELNQPFKWLEMHHDPDDENPYGTSELRSIYWAWMFKTAGYDFWLQATEKFSVNSIVALFSADGDEDAIQTKANSIAGMLSNLQSGSSASVGNVDSIQELGMAGKLSDFNQLVEACDLQISYGLTGQSIATSKTDGGSLALGEIQADMLYEDCKGIALEVQDVIQKLINWCVELNFGKGIKAPLYQFDIEQRATFDQVMSAIDRGIPVSKKSLYTKYGLKEPIDEEDSFIKQTPQSSLELSDSYSKKKLNSPMSRQAILFTN